MHSHEQDSTNCTPQQKNCKQALCAYSTNSPLPLHRNRGREHTPPKNRASRSCAAQRTLHPREGDGLSEVLRKCPGRTNPSNIPVSFLALAVIRDLIPPLLTCGKGKCMVKLAPGGGANLSCLALGLLPGISGANQYLISSRQSFPTKSVQTVSRHS